MEFLPLLIIEAILRILRELSWHSWTITRLGL